MTAAVTRRSAMTASSACSSVASGRGQLAGLGLPADPGLDPADQPGQVSGVAEPGLDQVGASWSCRWSRSPRSAAVGPMGCRRSTRRPRPAGRAGRRQRRPAARCGSPGPGPPGRSAPRPRQRTLPARRTRRHGACCRRARRTGHPGRTAAESWVIPVTPRSSLWMKDVSRPSPSGRRKPSSAASPVSERTGTYRGRRAAGTGRDYLSSRHREWDVRDMTVVRWNLHRGQRELHYRVEHRACYLNAEITAVARILDVDGDDQIVAARRRGDADEARAVSPLPCSWAVPVFAATV